MSGRHAKRTRIRKVTTQSGRVRWVVKHVAYDWPATAPFVYPTWRAAFEAAANWPPLSSTPRRFVPVGWERVRIDRKFEAAVYEWRFVWRCTACTMFVHKPAAHECMRWLDELSRRLARNYRPASRYPWSSANGLG